MIGTYASSDFQTRLGAAAWAAASGLAHTIRSPAHARPSSVLVIPLEDARAARLLWRRVQGGGVVEGTRVSLRVPFAISAAAFDPAGGEVLLAGQTELWHLALDPEPRLLARFDLRPLQAMVLGPEGRARPRADGLNAALCRHGTLLEVGDVDEAELARLRVPK